MITRRNKFLSYWYPIVFAYINLGGIFDGTGYAYVTPALVQQLKNPEGFWHFVITKDDVANMRILKSMLLAAFIFSNKLCHIIAIPD